MLAPPLKIFRGIVSEPPVSMLTRGVLQKTDVRQLFKNPMNVTLRPTTNDTKVSDGWARLLQDLVRDRSGYLPLRHR